MEASLAKSYRIYDRILLAKGKDPLSQVVLRYAREVSTTNKLVQSHVAPCCSYCSCCSCCSIFVIRCLVSKLFDVCSKSTPEQMEQLEEIRIPWGSGIVGYVAESGEPVNIPDAYKVWSLCHLTLEMTESFVF